MNFKVKQVEEVRHQVAIAGIITDSLTGGAISAALVQVEGITRDRKPLQTLTRTDGSFFLIDLPSGQYSLKVTLPAAGSRYNSTTVAVTVSNREPNRPIILDPRANIQLTPTRLLGLVRRSDTNQAIANASVQVRGSKTLTLTDKDGQYRLSGMPAGTLTIEISANGFITLNQKVVLTPGQATNQNFSLTPN
jgi:Carboxypeptidase regulatory-like domain